MISISNIDPVKSTMANTFGSILPLLLVLGGAEIGLLVVEFLVNKMREKAEHKKNLIQEMKDKKAMLNL